MQKKKKIKEKFEDINYCKVRDHCRYTDEYRGAADSICNSKFSIPKEITVVLHNGKITEKIEKI